MSLTILDIKLQQFTETLFVYSREVKWPRQYVIDVMTISPDETHVIIASNKESDIHMYDLPSLNFSRVIQGNYGSASLHV